MILKPSVMGFSSKYILIPEVSLMCFLHALRSYSESLRIMIPSKRANIPSPVVSLCSNHHHHHHPPAIPCSHHQLLAPRLDTCTCSLLLLPTQHTLYYMTLPQCLVLAMRPAGGSLFLAVRPAGHAQPRQSLSTHARH